MNESFLSGIERARQLIKSADYILIGGGAGLSTAAGMSYSGKRFQENFEEFIEKYSMTDMYTAGFYPFATEEEKWAFWSKQIDLNRWQPDGLPLYHKLFDLVKDKEYFVLTTNVDAQFEKAGFALDRIFAVQGDFGKIQCAKGCHDKLYDNQSLVRQMVAEQKDCRVPSYLVPKCPVCGGRMEVNVRIDMYFVQDKAWYDAEQRYERFLQKTRGKKLVLLELGVGYNTPTIIRYPFERMTYQQENTYLIRCNRNEAEAIPENREKTISFPEDMGSVLAGMQVGNPAQ